MTIITYIRIAMYVAVHAAQSNKTSESDKSIVCHSYQTSCVHIYIYPLMLRPF